MKLKNILSLTMALTMTFTATLSSSVFADEPVLSGEKETYVVLTETAKDGKEIISDYDGEALYSNEAVSCELTERQADKLEDQPGVLAVSEDIILRGTGKKSKDKKLIKNDAPEQWNLDAIGVSESDAKSSDVKIEVLDSGVSYTDDINIQSSVNLVPGEEQVSPMFVDANGHGTGIAGLIGAKDNNDGIKGVYPNAKIYSVKALDENLKSPLSRIVEGIYWGIENDMDIINMSFGTSVNTDVLHEAVKAAADAGIILIAAAGNTEHQNVNYPAAYNEVIAVGSINAEGELAELTSTGTQLELLAPGEQVYTTGLFYGTIGVGGTSIATAQVTGTAALLKAKDKTKSADFIRGLLKASSKEVAGTGAGLIDYNYALEIYNEYAKNYIDGENINNEFENTEEIPDYSDDADVVVEGLWNSSRHKEAINYANSSSRLTTDEVSLIAKISSWCDEKWSIHKIENGKKVDNPDRCNAVHGQANYVFTLKYLWYFAKKIKTIPTNTPMNTATDTASRYALSFIDRSKFSADETSKLVNLALKTQSVIANYGKSKDGRGRRNLVFGLIFHLLGDVYAHRTVVPKYTINDMKEKKVLSSTNTSKDAKFGTKDFSASKLKTFKSLFDNGGAGTEFGKVKKYTRTDVGAGAYEDNINFCKGRYADSKDACRYFLNHYSSGFDWITLDPIYNTKLTYFKGYLDILGEDTSLYTAKEWKERSSNDRF